MEAHPVKNGRTKSKMKSNAKQLFLLVRIVDIPINMSLIPYFHPQTAICHELIPG